LNKRFARRFVISAAVIIRSAQRYLQNTRRKRDAYSLREQNACFWEIKMRKTILIILGSAVIAASATQMAAAAQSHRSHKADRAPVTTNEQFRDSNAAWPAAQPDWSRYSSGGLSAPAGR
jgi:hypothetical protein